MVTESFASKVINRIPGQIKPWIRDIQDARARQFLEKNNVLSVLKNGEASEIGIVYRDLARLYKLLREKKPRVVFEMGVGFSSLVIAEALKANHREIGIEGHCWTLDAEQFWLDNTKLKVSNEAASYVTFMRADSRCFVYNNVLCAKFETLPDICPDFIYVDGPNHSSVKGCEMGLSFKDRPVIHVDPLFFEYSARKNFTILVDGRWRSIAFLVNNLQLAYRFTRSGLGKYGLFEKL